jgi:hypothetical protein
VILKEFTDEQVRKIAARPTPKPMAGTWRLVAPDGREWTADHPMGCMTAELNDRIPPLIALARIRRALLDEN